jgi:hypothetical protein
VTTAAAPTRAHRSAPDPAASPWTGQKRPYDLVKEFVIALVVVSILTVILAALFSSPDDKELTIATWAKAAPNDFVLTAATELDGTSGTATYGAPYTHDQGAAQKIGPIAPQNWPGVTIPIDTAQDFVVRPLEGAEVSTDLRTALTTWATANAGQQQTWASAYDDALSKAPDNDPTKATTGDFGPVPVMLGQLLSLAKSGGLDGALLAQGHFYQTDYTQPLLFVADGAYLEDLARAQHLGGDQWGMMNETGNYPGQAWLWLYTFWYQVKPFSTSGNGDALVWSLMALLTVVFVLIPFIPGVRSIPKWIPIHRLIWRNYYRDNQIPPPAR